MKIQYLSDLHLEFPENFAKFNKEKIVPTGDILVLAGDILPLYLLEEKHVRFESILDYFSANFEKVFWIAGNHEYYDYELTKKQGLFKEQIRDNVFLLNNCVEYFENCRIVFSTMWTKIAPINERSIATGMNDFRLILNNGIPLRPRDYTQLFERSFSFLKQEIEEPFAGKTIVVTHHVPTKLYYPAEYANSILEDGFVVELYDFIEKNKIDCWIYGHHHRNVSDFFIGNTLMSTNQMGYVAYNENKEFNTNKFFEV